MRAWRIPVCEPNLTIQDAGAVVEAVRTTWISGISPTVKQFECKFSQYCDCKYGIATNSGTTALHLALVSLGIGKGDEVIVPDFTMIASANAVAYTGAKPVFVDADPETWCINPILIEEKITAKTKAIMPVHIYGHPCNMNPIFKIADKYGLDIIEDAAEAHGAEYNHFKIGSLGDCGCFSFYANKIITTGEGGMIVTNNLDIMKNAVWLRAHAFGKHPRHHWHEALGFGYRMSGLQGALGSSQCDRLDELVELKRRNAEIYLRELQPLAEDGKIVLPVEESWAKNVYWMFTILLTSDYPLSRDELVVKLENVHGIETRNTFNPMHIQPIYKQKGDYPIAEMLGHTGLNLPSSTRLTEEEILEVCKWVKHYSKPMNG